jgi:hypothetical protein
MPSPIGRRPSRTTPDYHRPDGRGLTDGQLAAAREMFATGLFTVEELAKLFATDFYHLRRVITDRRPTRGDN